MMSKPNRDAIAAEIASKTGKKDASLPQSTSAYMQPPCRRKRAGLTTYHYPAVIQQLKEIALQERTTQQKLVAEALNHIFEKHNRPKIAGE